MMYAVYDLKDYEQCIGIFDNCKEVAEFFDTTKNNIWSGMAHGCLRKHRFEIVRLENE